MKIFPVSWGAGLRRMVYVLISCSHLFARCRVSLAILLIAGVSTLAKAQTLSASMPFPQFNSSYISGTDIPIQVTATTPAGTTITKVEFFFDAAFSGTYTKIGEDLTAPYSVTWTAPGVPTTRGYQIRAVVTNSASATAVANAGTGYNGISIYAPTYVSTRNWYVSAAASSTNTAGTEASPFNSLQKAADRVAPGDTVFAMGGSYTATSINLVQIQRTGLPGKWIVFMPYKGDKPVLQLGNVNFNGFNVLPAGAYIRIQGFEVIGNNATITLAQAQAQPGACESGPASASLTPTARFNGNGMSVTGRGGETLRPHHVVIANNSIHDCAGGGAGSGEADYVTIEDNTIYNNSWYTVYGTSGISLGNCWNFDNSSEVKMIVRRNRCYGNILKIAWNIGGTGTNCKFYDGNGIILDNNRANDPNNPGVVKNSLGNYTGKFLIENNLCYKNGGRGININYSDNAIVLNNTTYQNGQSDGGFGVGIDNEFIMQGSVGARIYNNIFSGKPGELPSSVSGSSDVLQNNNLTFSNFSNGYFTGNQNIVGKDPLFVNAAAGDFRLSDASPAVNRGSAVAGQYALTDLLGVARPQGAGVDMGAYEFQGTPVAITQQPASRSLVCAGTPVSVSVGVSGSVQAYQWYKDGSPLTGVASATTATLSLPAVTAADQGNYALAITGFTNATTATFSLTVTALPQPPNLLTQTGQPYPGNVASLTISQNTGPVTLVATGCAGGTLTWAGGAATTLAVSTASVGSYAYSAACQQNGCTGPAASAEVTVVPTTLSVSQRDPDNGQLNTNTIKPYLQLNNAGNSAIPYGDITVRYWLTAENFAPLLFQINYAQLGSDNVHPRYVALDQPRQGAYGYVEYSFDASAGQLNADSNSGPIQNSFTKQDYSPFNQTDDYSYINKSNFTLNPRITAYLRGADGIPVVVWGQEPAPVPAVQTLKVFTQQNSGPTANSISTILQVINEGTLGVNYKDLTVRYYFTADGAQPVNVSLGYVQLGGTNIQTRFVAIPPLLNADTYLELSFAPDLGVLSASSSTGTIGYEIRKADYSYFTMSNDHSYQGTTPMVENNRVTAYINDSLVYGQEPATPANSRLGATENRLGLTVAVMGNPIPGDAIRVAVSGTEGQPLRLVLTDVQGHLVAEQQTDKAGVVDHYTLPVDRAAAGILLLRVSTPTESRTLKLLNP